MNTDQLLTTAEAAEVLGISPVTLRAHVSTGRYNPKPAIVIAKRALYLRSDIARVKVERDTAKIKPTTAAE